MFNIHLSSVMWWYCNDTYILGLFICIDNIIW